MDALLADLRYALRTLAKSPGFTLVAVLTLALGVGANSLLFSVIYAVLLRPLPYPEPGRIVSLGVVPNDARAARQFADVVPHTAYFAWRDQSRSFAALTAYRPDLVDFGNGVARERVRGADVTAGFFSVLGVHPAIGRSFTADDELESGPPAVVLSYGLWQERFGGDRSIVGRAVDVDGAPATVVGVLPVTFGFPLGARFWRPLRLPRSGPCPSPAHRPGKTTCVTLFVWVIGRLAPSVSIAQARGELAAIAGAEPVRVLDLAGAGVEVVTLHERLYGSARLLLLILLGVVAFVLLIACANVASMLVARATTRAREFAVRAALGAGRLRLVRQLLAESVLLATLGAAAGLLVPVAGLRVFMHLAPLGTAQSVDVHLDAVVLTFTAGLALLTGVTFGVAPALTASRPDLLEGLKSGGPTGTSAPRARIREGLVAVELAAALLLLTGAGLLTRSLLNLSSVDPGFRADHLVVAYPQGRRPITSQSDLLERLRALPGVASAALAGAPPLGGFVMTRTVRVDNAPPGSAAGSGVAINPVSVDYFKAVGATMLAGRSFIPADRAGAQPVAIVNRTFARRFVPGGDAVGHRLEDVPPRTIVGEVADIRQIGQDIPAEPEVFVPALQAADFPQAMVIRTVGDAAALVEPVRKAVQESFPDQPAPRVLTLESELARLAAPRRVNAILLGLFAAVALVLAAVGLAGVMAGLVAQRSHEVGVRMALGAERTDVLRLIVGEAARLVAVGGVIGIVAALALTRLLRTLLFGVQPTDLATFLIAPLVLGIVALLAAALPARRAARVDPMVALRYE
jgi:putative ABC transport system permease protein